MALVFAVVATPLAASPITYEGPGRFCGYSAAIDLLEGETITPTSSGVHAGTFEWTGEFGTLEVRNIGWASRPEGRATAEPTATGQVRFEERRERGKRTIAIWNGAYGAAYFTSARPLTTAQIVAIERVDLFDEKTGRPPGCKFRTVFGGLG